MHKYAGEVTMTVAEKTLFTSDAPPEHRK